MLIFSWSEPNPFRLTFESIKSDMSNMGTHELGSSGLLFSLHGNLTEEQLGFKI